MLEGKLKHLTGVKEKLEVAPRPKPSRGTLWIFFLSKREKTQRTGRGRTTDASPP